MIGHPDRGEYHSSTLTKRIFTYKNEKVKQHETDVTPSNSYQEMVEKETEIENLFHVRTDMKNSDKDQLFREETTVSEELIINAKAIGSNKEPDGQLSEPPSGTPSETPCGTLSGPLSVPLRGQPSGPPSGPPREPPSGPPSGPPIGPDGRARFILTGVKEDFSNIEKAFKAEESDNQGDISNNMKTDDQANNIGV